ncbi:cytochrome c biogenesis CcdA family protein [Ancylobacter pratisalsi]|uniref:Cytochrome c biogenesis protein CcdA n=1 Tax=Ancylobacter pratisalsi TaxID=1745854 RepID=A0A6P1YQ54_9HYPH|nr:cytochrome c biogenesis protein CcdA [Ancylobacter pratisalsi]QIB35519.1 cytochrome c biogenesis protein CcdA [Ancylobacter pratisalsi]
MADVTLPAAFVAGIASFASPCVLPLVPPYLCYLAGTSLDQITHKAPTDAAARRTLGAALLFVAGFSTVFVALGAGASVVGGYLRLYSQEFAFVAGIAILLMGLHFLGILRFNWLTHTKRVHVDAPSTLAGAYVMGLAFAFGWTPCIGPVLAAILAVAASEQTLARGAGLLAVYSAGLGVPFILVAAMARPALALLSRTRRYLPMVEKAMGALLVLTGIGFLSGWMSTLSYWMLETFPALANFG